jgi:hypothetical protein
MCVSFLQVSKGSTHGETSDADSAIQAQLAQALVFAGQTFLPWKFAQNRERPTQVPCCAMLCFIVAGPRLYSDFLP